jgi:hypothetical protein
MAGGHLTRAELRVSDEEREDAVAALRHHFTRGRLTAEELADRTAHAYRARSRGELAALGRDLPRGPGRRRRWLALVERTNRRALRWHGAAYASVQSSALVIWSVTGEGAFWPAWALVPGTVLLGWHVVVTRQLRRALRTVGSPRAPRALGGG